MKNQVHIDYQESLLYKKKSFINLFKKKFFKTLTWILNELSINNSKLKLSIDDFTQEIYWDYWLKIQWYVNSWLK